MSPPPPPPPLRPCDSRHFTGTVWNQQIDDQASSCLRSGGRGGPWASRRLGSLKEVLVLTGQHGSPFSQRHKGWGLPCHHGVARKPAKIMREHAPLCLRRQPAAPTSVHPGVSAGVKACHPPDPLRPPRAVTAARTWAHEASRGRGAETGPSAWTPLARAGWTVWPQAPASAQSPRTSSAPNIAEPMLLN